MGARGHCGEDGPSREVTGALLHSEVSEGKTESVDGTLPAIGPLLKFLFRSVVGGGGGDCSKFLPESFGRSLILS